MKGKKGNSKMIIPTIIMGVLAIILLYVGYNRGQNEHIIGLQTAWRLLAQMLPYWLLP